MTPHPSAVDELARLVGGLNANLSRVGGLIEQLSDRLHGQVLEMPGRAALNAEMAIGAAIELMHDRGFNSGLFALPRPMLVELCRRLLDVEQSRRAVWRWLNEEQARHGKPAISHSRVYRFAQHFRKAYRAIQPLPIAATPPPPPAADDGQDALIDAGLKVVARTGNKLLEMPPDVLRGLCRQLLAASPWQTARLRAWLGHQTGRRFHPASFAYFCRAFSNAVRDERERAARRAAAGRSTETE